MIQLCWTERSITVGGERLSMLARLLGRHLRKGRSYGSAETQLTERWEIVDAIGRVASTVTTAVLIICGHFDSGCLFGSKWHCRRIRLRAQSIPYWFSSIQVSTPFDSLCSPSATPNLQTETISQKVSISGSLSSGRQEASSVRKTLVLRRAAMWTCLVGLLETLRQVEKPYLSHGATIQAGFAASDHSDSVSDISNFGDGRGRPACHAGRVTCTT